VVRNGEERGRDKKEESRSVCCLGKKKKGGRAEGGVSFKGKAEKEIKSFVGGGRSRIQRGAKKPEPIFQKRVLKRKKGGRNPACDFLGKEKGKSLSEKESFSLQERLGGGPR